MLTTKRLCPYCRSDVRFVSLTTCRTCRTKTHTECWESHGGCPVFGCKRQEAISDPAFSWFTNKESVALIAALASIGIAVIFPGSGMFYLVLLLSLLFCAGVFVSDRR